MSLLARAVAANLRHLRDQQKLTQQDLAQKADLSTSYISMLERGNRTPPIPTLERLAHALRIEPWRLLKPPTSA